MKKCNKGFTLVELLVTISILGLITAMSMPIIRNIIEANTLKKYITYKDSVESSAKLYVDSYSEDLFGKNKSGCAYITYDQMKDKNLIKNIQDNNVSCDSDKTYVRVVKLNGKYTYATQIGCGNSSGNEKITSSKVNVLYPKGGVPRNETCSYDAVTKLSVKVSPYEKYEKTDKKKYALNIILESFTGINNGVEISYAWHKEGTDSSKDVWQDATFRSMASSKQEEQILNGQTITLKSSEILTPDKEIGCYKLLVKINKAMDITGTDLITDLNKIVTFGLYKIDNLPPVINSLSVSSTNKSYNALKAKVNINATDNNMLSSQNDVKVCIKTNTSSCSSNDYKTYASSYDITIPGGKYDGSKKTVYVYVKDNAGNVTSKTVDYILYKECSTSILDSNNLKEKGTCTKKCGGGTRLDTYGKKDKYTGVQCSGTAKKQETCNTMDCCSKVNYTDGSICSKTCGGGTLNRIARSAFDNSACPSLNTSTGGSACGTGICDKTITITFTGNGSSTNEKRSCTYHPYLGESGCSITTPYINRPGWNIYGWNTNVNATSASVGAGASVYVTSNTTYYAISSKWIVSKFNFKISDRKNLYYISQEADARGCNIWNTGNTCIVTAPNVNMGKTIDNSQAIKGYFNLRWNGNNKSVVPGSNVWINDGELFNLSASPKSEYVGVSNKIYVFYNANAILRGNQDTLFSEGVSTKTIKGWIATGGYFKWDGVWIIDSHNKLVWFRGQGVNLDKTKKCVKIKDDSNCNGTTNKIYNAYISLRLLKRR